MLKENIKCFCEDLNIKLKILETNDWIGFYIQTEEEMKLLYRHMINNYNIPDECVLIVEGCLMISHHQKLKEKK
jgi:hypothetical protein